ncbi:MAG: DUF2975 domain-containing protein [Lachnospiraceae bacterium]|nr:DUF2975 domain-containing protein [Lachnospiraceae bacterium]
MYGDTTLTKWTKHLLDFMFYMGIAVIVTLPISVKLIGRLYRERMYSNAVLDNYAEIIAVYFVLGVLAEILVFELRKIFNTVLKGDCFVMENVQSLKKMGNVSFFIAAMSVVRSVVYLTVAMLVVVLVFVIAGLFSRVLAQVFEQAVRYKEENDLTI